ncbi:MAG TPA: terpene synthase family protein [Actinomycetota bacterium]|nr:terpene synthase family protein [Actinomycetota bacterium]
MGVADHPLLGLSDLYLPARPTIENPLAPAAIEATRLSATRFGLIDDRFDLRRFYAFASSATYFYPNAGLEAMIACSDWCAWLFFLDDSYDENVEASWNHLEARRLMVLCLDVLRGADPPVGAPPLARFTREIRRRVLAVAPAGERWLRRFAASAEGYLYRGVLPANANWARGVVPDVDAYLVQREHDSAVHTCIDLIELADGLSLRDEVHVADPLPAMRRLCARALAYANDLMSYEKEVLRNGNPNNLVHVVMERRRLPFELAVHRVVGLINHDTRQLVELEGELLERSPPPSSVARYAAGMRQLLRGNYDWSLATARYRSERSPFPELRPLPRSSLRGAAS